MNSAVPALRYPMARANAIAALLIRARSSLLDDGDADAPRDRLCRELVSTLPQALCGRADEDETCGFDRLGEVGALREEAVAGMDRVGTGSRRSANVLLGMQVACDLDGLVGA